MDCDVHGCEVELVMVGVHTPTQTRVQPAPIYAAIKPISVALAGIGGYGDHYLRALLDGVSGERHGVRFVGAVDPFAHRSHRRHELERNEVPVHDHLDALYADGPTPDLVVLASPIAVHAEQTIRALDRGSHVLCEKPLAATVEQARAMIAARDRSGGRIVGIGYQWSFCDAIQRLKRDVAAGLFGRPIRLSTLVLWPRDRLYYQRNSWAGRMYDAGSGAPIFDSPVNNAAAHFLHNMLYVLGRRTDRSAMPARVTAELYRANAIQNYDTAAIRCVTTDGAELLFYVSHATETSAGPRLEYVFEQATVRCDGDGPLVAYLRDGGQIDYGTPASALDLSKLWRTVDAARAGRAVECGIEASLPQTQVMCAAQRSAAAIGEFPSELVKVAGLDVEAPRVFVAGLGEQLQQCFAAAALPHEIGIDWAVAGNEIVIEDGE